MAALMNRRRRKLPSTQEVALTSALFGVLAHPTRLYLLMALSRRGPLSAGELQQHVGAEQSAVSHQLATLREHRLVTAERAGRHMIYSLLDDHVAHILEDAISHANE